MDSEAAGPRGRCPQPVEIALLASVFVVAACGLVYELSAARWPRTCWATRCCSSPPSSAPTCSRWAWARGCRAFRAPAAGALPAHRAAGGAGRRRLPALLFLANAWPGAFRLLLYGLVLVVGTLVGLEIPLVMRILKRNVG
jgi:spermidine synthase